MATVREGNQSVLLIVDVQVGVMKNAWDSPRIIRNIGGAVAKARSARIPILWVQHSDDRLVHGTPDWELVPELIPAGDDPRVQKHFGSSFEQTSLEETLAQLGASHIVLAGAATNWCIRATAYAALDRGYDLTLISDAHSAATIDLGEIRIDAATVVHDLNFVMTHLRYPGRTSGTTSAEDVDFAALGCVRSK